MSLRESDYFRSDPFFKRIDLVCILCRARRAISSSLSLSSLLLPPSFPRLRGSSFLSPTSLLPLKPLSHIDALSSLPRSPSASSPLPGSTLLLRSSPSLYSSSCPQSPAQRPPLRLRLHPSSRRSFTSLGSRSSSQQRCEVSCSVFQC